MSDDIKFDKNIRNKYRVIGGVTLIRDELFCKVKEEFKAFIGLGESVKQAEDIFINFFENTAGSIHDKAICYLALGYIEHQVGRLTQKIKDKVIEILDSTNALYPWIEATTIPKYDYPRAYISVFEDEEAKTRNINNRVYFRLGYDEDVKNIFVDEMDFYDYGE